MFPRTIDTYAAPKTVQEALHAMADQGGHAMFIAGGQSLMQAIKSRLVSPQGLIDLQGVAELKGITQNNDGIRIGAMTRYRDIASDPRLDGCYAALRDAASHVGDRQVRNRGTIGGSLCWNYLAACMPPTCIGLGASVELSTTDGARRTLRVEDFLKGPLETARDDDELLVAVTLPPPPARAGSAYKKWGLVTDALPVVGVCVSIAVDDAGKCMAARFCVGGLATGPRRSAAGEAALIGKSLRDRDALAAAADTAAAAITTQTDMWADADYRKVLIAALARDVIATAFARTGGEK
jgi:carbon-monoxide dehydrogenase medium subunit